MAVRGAEAGLEEAVGRARAGLGGWPCQAGGLLHRGGVALGPYWLVSVAYRSYSKQRLFIENLPRVRHGARYLYTQIISPPCHKLPGDRECVTHFRILKRA